MNSALRLIGNSPVMQEVRALVERVAQSPVSTVFIKGESGTGKDLAAHAIHQASPRAHRAFVTIACSALPESLLDTELFGHETGAAGGGPMQGLLELSNGGTVFLDEVSEMAPALQAKLLRFIDERAFRRIAGTTDIHVDVRVLAATHRDMRDLVSTGKFRQDLYYRLRGVPIQMPPLRERKEDVEALCLHFMGVFNGSFGKTVTHIAPRALEELRAHDWPGNVRELRHTIERSMLLADGDCLTRADCGSTRRSASEHFFRLPPEGLVLAQVERSLVQQALEATHWNQVRAARLLGLNRDQVRYRIEKFGLCPPATLDDGRAA